MSKRNFHPRRKHKCVLHTMMAVVGMHYLGEYNPKEYKEVISPEWYKKSSVIEPAFCLFQCLFSFLVIAL